MIAIFPELAKCVLANNLPRLTMLIRQYYAPELTETKKLNIHELIANIGIQVRRGPIQELAVILAKDSKGAFEVSIIINHKLDMGGEEYQFLLAHLLGHFFWHIQPKIAKGEWGSSGFRELVSPYQRFFKRTSLKSPAQQDARVETEADAFAASLLQIDVDSKPVSFAHAEHKLNQQTDNFGERKPAAVPAAPLHSDQTISAKMPRSFAASSYDQMKKNTTPAAKTNKAANMKTPAATAPSAHSPLEDDKEKTLARGMDRLRKLAKRIDHSVE